jgi:tripartite ATP-independent transporter DctM subunit
MTADPLAIGLLGLAALFGLIALRTPIAYAMILVGGVGMAALAGPAVVLNQLKTLAYGQFSVYDLSVVPMFVLMGALATRAGLSRDLFRAASAWLGRARGGLAMAAIAACAGFGAVCGSSLATASTMGRVALPELQRARYSGALATGTLAAGGALGILIPPSVVLVVYAIVVEANIVTMFMAALVPGLLAVVFFVATIALFVAVRPEAGPRAAPADRAELRAASLGVLPVAAIFGLVIGGIYAGLFTPTAAAAIGVALVGSYGALRGRIGLGGLRASLLETAATAGMIYLILLGAELLKIFMARAGAPQAAADWLGASGLAPMTVLILLLLALIVLGCLMDSLSMVLLAIPFFWPLLVELNGGPFVAASEAGFGMTTEELKIWFGILALIVVELGLITPPVGMNVFIIASLSRGTPMGETFMGAVPFFCAEIVRVALLLAAPGLVFWLPTLLSG